MEFHFALDWVSIFDYFYGSVIAYYYLIMPNFTVEESVVVFVLSSSKLQKYLVDNIIWLVKIIPIIFLWNIIEIVLILIEVIFIFRIMWLFSCELFVRWILFY